MNQRGENSYTGFEYTVDRWLNDQNATVNIVSNGITITGNLWQRLENELYEQLISKTCTLSVLLADGTIYQASGSVTSSNGIYITIDNDDVYCTFQKDSSYTFIDLWSKVGANITFRAVKLEIGTISTLSMDAPPNYATELLKCQRYFVRYDNNTYDICLVGASYNTGGTFNIPLPTNMRIKPTATLRNIGSFYSNGTQCTPTGVITVDSLINNSLRVYIFINETLTNYTPVIVDLLKIDFSADL